jgi:hypothetical protein
MAPASAHRDVPHALLSGTGVVPVNNSTRSSAPAKCDGKAVCAWTRAGWPGIGIARTGAQDGAAVARAQRRTSLIPASSTPDHQPVLRRNREGSVRSRYAHDSRSLDSAVQGWLARCAPPLSLAGSPLGHAWRGSPRTISLGRDSPARALTGGGAAPHDRARGDFAGTGDGWPVLHRTDPACRVFSGRGQCRTGARPAHDFIVWFHR